MDFFSHLLIGVLTSLVTLNKLAPEYIILAAIMAILPDMDLFLIPVQKLTKSYYLSHRGGSHSYIIGLMISPIIAILFTEIYGGPFFMYLFIGFMFYSLHVTLDLITTSKIPIFYPISKKEYRYNVERAVNPLLMLTSFLVIHFFISLHNQEVPWIVQFTFRNVFFLLYYFYLGYKLLTKLWIQSQLPKDSFYIPGIFPLVFYIYNVHNQSDKITFRLIKGVQLIPLKVQILEYIIETHSNKMNYYEKARAISKNYRFFSKWEAVFPIIKENEEKIVVILFLAESYSIGVAYFLKVQFDKNSGEFLKKSDGFYSIKRLEKKLLT